jgi:hypothetical protein
VDIPTGEGEDVKRAIPISIDSSASSDGLRVHVRRGERDIRTVSVPGEIIRSVNAATGIDLFRAVIAEIADALRQVQE